MRKNQNISGQALVLVLLSLAVVLTIVLYVLARSVTDIAVSSRSEDAVRAFSAAEAGIEQALILGAGGVSQVGDATFSSTVTDFASGQQSFVYPLTLASGEASSLWFSNHDSSGNIVCDAQHPCFTGRNLQICWGRVGTDSNLSTTPAIELTVVYETTPEDVSTARIARAVYDPNSSRLATNGFAASDVGVCTVDGETFQFQKTIDLASLGVPAGSYNTQGGLQFAKIRMFYNSSQKHNLGFNLNFPGGSLLPAQGVSINSSGTAGQSQRRLNVFQGWAEAPDDLNFSVFSPSGVNK